MRMVQTYHVFVQFKPYGTNELGLAYSIEPRKWHRLLVDCAADPTHLGIDRDVFALGFSEWPTSMNLKVALDPTHLADELEHLKTLIAGSSWVNIFEPLHSTPSLATLASRATPKVRSIAERLAA